MVVLIGAGLLLHCPRHSLRRRRSLGSARLPTVMNAVVVMVVVKASRPGGRTSGKGLGRDGRGTRDADDHRGANHNDGSK